MQNIFFGNCFQNSDIKVSCIIHSKNLQLPKPHLLIKYFTWSVKLNFQNFSFVDCWYNTKADSDKRPIQVGMKMALTQTIKILKYNHYWSNKHLLHKTIIAVFMRSTEHRTIKTSYGCFSGFLWSVFIRLL